MNTNDDADFGTCGGHCSLREAINAANANPGADTISFNVLVTGEIKLETALPAITDDVEIVGPGSDVLTVKRDSAALVGKTVEQGFYFSVFTIAHSIYDGPPSSTAVTISGLTIAEGKGTDFGGIINAGILTVSDCVIRGNDAGITGGGIVNSGTLTVNNSAISDNTAVYSGGGITNYGRNEASTATTTINHSTISGNRTTYELVAGTAGIGGGVYNWAPDGPATLTINNSTISGNSAGAAGGFESGASGGGVANHSQGCTSCGITATLTINNSTITGNTTGNSARTSGSSTGGGIYNAEQGPTSVTIRNSTVAGNSAFGYYYAVGGGISNDDRISLPTISSSIIALNSSSGFNPAVGYDADTPPGYDVYGDWTSNGYNFIGRADIQSTGFTDGVNHDQVGTNVSPKNPKLETDGGGNLLLKDNGGPTKTIALLSDSPAVDQGTSNSFTTDQRGAGFLRTFDDPAIPNAADGTDIGAFELKPLDSIPPPTAFALSPGTPNGLNSWYVTNVHATVSAADNVGGSGVAETRCVLDPLSAPASFDAIPAGCAYTGAGADVTTDGQHTLYAASSDTAGNKEGPVSRSFKIDKTPPTLAMTGVAAPADGFMPAQNFSSFPATVGAQPVTLSGTVSDGGSGVASVTVEGVAATLGSGTWSKGGLSLATGANTLHANATDAAGNTLAVPVAVGVTLNLDLDGDSIANNVDGNSTVSPAVPKATVACTVGSPTEPCRFSDKQLGGQTSGRVTLVPAGMSFKFTDASGTALKGASTVPAGLTLVVTGVSGKVNFTLDGSLGIYKDLAGTYVVTDPTGSITVETVAGGPAEIDYILNGSTTVISIPAGASATITETTNASGVLTGVAVKPLTSTAADPVTLNGQPLPVGQTNVIGALSGRLSISDTSFSYAGTFTPGASSNGVNPRTEEVALKIGLYTFLMPAGSFRIASDGAYAFNGTVSGVKMSMQLTAANGGKWNVKANGKPVSGVTNSSPVKLRIGDDVTP